MWHLVAGELTQRRNPGAGRLSLRSPLLTGLASGEYMPIAGVAELPRDQREDDARSLCFDTPPLDEPLVVLGTPRAWLRVSADRPAALIAARLCDVAPDGASTLVSFGVLNLRLREGRERDAILEPGACYDIGVRLNDVGYALAAGHRLRLALSSNFWPMAWPMPEHPTLTIALAHSRLELPVRHIGVADALADPLGPPLAADPPPVTWLREASGTRRIEHDIATDTLDYRVENDGGVVRFHDTRLDYGASNSQCYTLREGDPLSARIEYRAGFSFARDEWQVRTESRLLARCDREHFIIDADIRAFEAGEPVFERRWTAQIPRVVY